MSAPAGSARNLPSLPPNQSSNDYSTVDVSPSGEPHPFLYADRYYYGLPSCPRLLAGSRTFEHYWWDGTGNAEWGTTGHQPMKRMFTIRSMSLRRQWYIAVRPALETYLRPVYETMSAEASIDVVRIGYSEESAVDMIWLGVQSNFLLYDRAVTLVADCEQILHSFGIHDVEVEMREAQVHPASESALLDPALHLERCSRPFTLSNGLPINVANRDGFATCGLILRKPTGQLVGLTCQHVVTAEKELTRPLVAGAEYPIISVRLPNSWKEDVDSDVINEQSLADIQSRRMQYTERKANREDIADALEKGRVRDKDELEKLAAKLKENWENAGQRVLGQVLCHPASVKQQMQYERDWALFTINPKRLQRIANELNMRGEKGDDVIRRSGMDSATLDDPAKYRLLTIRGTMSEEQCKQADFFVLKNGAKTGITLGKVELESATFRKDRWIHRVCVICTDSYFSQKGDSGSIVVSTDGTIVGLLTGGSRGGDGRALRMDVPNDITYLNPFYWLERDIFEFGLDVTPV